MCIQGVLECSITIVTPSWSLYKIYRLQLGVTIWVMENSRTPCTHIERWENWCCDMLSIVIQFFNLQDSKLLFHLAHKMAIAVSSIFTLCTNCLNLININDLVNFSAHSRTCTFIYLLNYCYYYFINSETKIKSQHNTQL